MRIRSLGAAAMLRDYVPALLPGLAGAAFHPIIHTGWAIEANHLDMICDGLAYMATAYQPLATDSRHTPPAHLWLPGAAGPIKASLAFLSSAKASGLSIIAQDASQTEVYQQLKRGSFQPRLIAFDDPGLSLAQALNSASPIGLPDVGESLDNAIEEIVVIIAANLNASDNEFFVLHGLTSLYATLNLVPYLEPEDQRLALAFWWRAAMATIVVQDFPGLSLAQQSLENWSGRQTTSEPHHNHQLGEKEISWWSTTLQQTLVSHDEHIPKAVYVLQQWAQSGKFSKNTVAMLEDTAKNVARRHPSGQVHQNLTYSPLRCILNHPAKESENESSSVEGSSGAGNRRYRD